MVPSDYSLRHFTAEAIESIGNADSRVLRSLRALLLRPGWLTTEYIAGRVIEMIPLFALVLSILYFRARRYYVQHLVFSLHFYAFFLLLLIGVWGLLAGLNRLSIAAGVEPERIAWAASDPA